MGREQWGRALGALAILAVLIVGLVLGLRHWSEFTSAVTRDNEIFAVCMERMVEARDPAVSHWQAAQSCFALAPHSQAGIRVMQGYGMRLKPHE
jgi:hypothetical protein